MHLLARLIDPMVRLLLLAILLAFLIPASGDARGVARFVSNGAIFVLFLLNGLRIDRRDILRGAANVRFLLPLGVWVFGVMALAGLAVSRLFEPLLPSLIALGFIYLGTLPSTVQSATSYTSLARGNVALSVIGAALVNIAGVFLSAPIFALLAGSGQADVGTDVFVRIALILVLPFLIGQLLQNYTRSWIEAQRDKVVWVDRIVIALAVYVAFSGAVEQGIWQRVDPAIWIAIMAGIMAMLLFGNFGAWIAGRLLSLPPPDRIAFLFAGSQKSAAVGVPLGAILFPPEIAGFVLIPLLLYHLLQLMVAAPVSSYLAKRPE